MESVCQAAAGGTGGLLRLGCYIDIRISWGKQGLKSENVSTHCDAKEQEG